MVMEADKLRICRVNWQAGGPEGQTFQLESESRLLEKSLLLGGWLVFLFYLGLRLIRGGPPT